MEGDFLVAGVSALAITIAFVFALRRMLHLTRQGTVVAAFVIGQLLSVGSYMAVRYPEFTELWQAIVGGLVVALMAMGTWSGGKALQEK